MLAFTVPLGGGRLAMALKHLIEEICRRSRKMSASKRIAKIRKLVKASPEDARFIQKYFPELYDEAFPSESAGGESWESDRRVELAAKR